ncbi:MAG: hypothetical protein LBI35_01110 [Burkholderiales bacterium]|jgi:hypothetical protein|nr:hypothetical protein [Burkholderiales bacterium]
MLQAVSRGDVRLVKAPEYLVPDIETVALSFDVLSRLVDAEGGKSERIARDEVCDFLRAQRTGHHIAFAPPAEDARAALAVLAGLIVNSRDLIVVQAFQVIECFIRAKQESDVRHQASGNVVRA